MIVKPTIPRSIHHPKIYRSILPSMCPGERQLEENEDNTDGQQKPRSSRIGVGWSGWRVRLVGACRKHLAVAQAVHVAEQRRSGRQTSRIGEVHVETVITVWRGIYGGTALKHAGI